VRSAGAKSGSGGRSRPAEGECCVSLRRAGAHTPSSKAKEEGTHSPSLAQRAARHHTPEVGAVPHQEFASGVAQRRQDGACGPDQTVQRRQPSRYDRTASEQDCSLQLIYIKLACHISPMEPAAKLCVGLYSTQLKTFLANSKDNHGLQSRCSTSALGVSIPTISAAAGAVLAPRSANREYAARQSATSGDGVRKHANGVEGRR
jgi:hypothetical protein